MAYLRPYRVAQTTTTTGTGSITLAGAVTGYASFAAELANGDTATIVIEAIDAAGRPTGDYEICDTAFTSPSTLSRGTLRDSSTGSRINFAAGSKRVFAINPRDLVDLGSADLIGTLPVAKGGTGTATAFTAGSVVFAGASGVYSQDNANLFWDNANDRLGIGTSSPAVPLEVAGNIRSLGLLQRVDNSGLTLVGGTTFNTTGASMVLRGSSSAFNAYGMEFYAGGSERMRVISNGNVGIGTSTPAQRLHVRQDQNGTTAALIQNRNGTGSPASALQFISGAFDLTDNRYAMISSAGGSNTTLQFWTGSGATPTERMRITSAGDVGIGTSSPVTKLEVKGSGFVAASISGDSTSETQLRFNTNTSARISQQANQSLIFDTNATERMRITSAGNVGIGTSSPTERLDTGTGNTRTQALVVSGDQHLIYSVSSTELGIRIGTGGPYYGIGTTGSSNMRINSSSGGDMLFAIGGTERARINSSGEFLVGTTSGGRTVCINAADNWIRQQNPSRSWLIGPSIGTSFNIWDETGGYNAFSIDTSANINARNSMFLGAGQNLDNKIEIGSGRTGSNYAYIDLIGDTTYTDYGLRLIRGNGGANTTSQLVHRGTGDMYITTQDAATMYFQTNSTTRMYIEAGGTMQMSGSLLVGRSSASTDVNTANDTGSFSVRGSSTTIASMSFHRTGAYAINMGLGTDNVFRIGGWSASSNCFQMDGSGNLAMLGSVTAATNFFAATGGVWFNAANTFTRGIAVAGSDMAHFTSGIERMRITSAGKVGIGTSSPDATAILDVSSTTAGFLPPRMSTAERDAIGGGAPPEGLILYNNTTDKLQVYSQGAWVNLH